MHSGDPLAEVIAGKQNKTVRWAAPFASKLESARITMDRKIDLDLAVATSFAIQVKGDGEQVDSRVSLYFHSGQGWYSGGAYLRKSGWRKLVFNKEDFAEEGTPAGWDQIDSIRISIWRSEKNAKDSAFDLGKLEAFWNQVAIVVPDAENSEFKTSQAVAERIAQMLRESGVGSDFIDTGSLVSGALGERPLVILPHNPRLGSEALAALGNLVENGGKIFACYSLDAELGEILGFKIADYFAQKKPGDFSALQFENKEVPGLPAKVGQVSWNIKTAVPSGHQARVIGRWLDGEGKATGKAALLVSDRGVFFSHIILADDWSNKKAMLLALLGKLYPQIWQEAAGNSWVLAEKTGHCQSVAELAEVVKGKAGEKLFVQAQGEMARSKELLAGNQGFVALQAAKRARTLFADAYLSSQPSREVEARAFWNHSGTGAYPGDWQRTTDEMAAAGLNMILPNMLWGGVAHYPSDVLPRSKTFENYGDQIQQCVEAAHKSGIEVHVWKVNYNLGHNVPEAYVKKLRAADRLQVDVEGEPGDWLNPAHPDNFKMELESILEVVRNYDIDGFHFDYIRYPNSRNDFSGYSRKKFEADTGNRVKNWPADCYDGALKEAYTDWRCAQITKLVKAVSEQARIIRPGIKISAAVFRDYPRCRQWVAQDWPLWAKEGYVDFLCPMDYTDNDEKYLDWIIEQKALLPKGFPLYPGIGVSLRGKTQSADRVVGQIELNRQVGTGGFTIFNLDEGTLQDVARGLSMGAGKTKAKPPHAVKK